MKKPVDQWVSEISSAWYRHVDGILEAGKLIVRAEEPEAGLSLAERRELQDKLPFSAPIYSKLKTVAIRFSDEGIEKEQLPPLYSALYELSHLPLEAITAAIRSGEMRSIHEPTRRNPS